MLRAAFMSSTPERYLHFGFFSCILNFVFVFLQVNSETIEVVGDMPPVAAEAIEIRVTGSTQMRSVVEFAVNILQVRRFSLRMDCSVFFIDCLLPRKYFFR